VNVKKKIGVGGRLVQNLVHANCDVIGYVWNYRIKINSKFGMLSFNR
jgi:hypothetical protein